MPLGEAIATSIVPRKDRVKRCGWKVVFVTAGGNGTGAAGTKRLAS